MGHMRKFAWVLVLLITMNLALAVHAAEEPAGVWMNTETTGDTVVVSICTDTEVKSGLIRLRFDSTQLTYTELQIDTELFAVNTNEPGVVLISWVADKETDTDADSWVLMQVIFTGTLPEDLTLSGEVYTSTGETIRVTNLDFSALEAAIADVQGLKKEDYTADSFAAFEAALAEAKALLEDVTATQKNVDAAVQKLRSAVDALEPAPVENPGDDIGGSGDQKTPVSVWVIVGLVAAVLLGGAVIVGVIVIVIVIIKKKGAAK